MTLEIDIATIAKLSDENERLLSENERMADALDRIAAREHSDYHIDAQQQCAKCIATRILREIHSPALTALTDHTR